MKDNLWWKTTFDGRRYLIEDDLWWKTTFDGRQTLMEDHFWWKTTFDGRQITINGRWPKKKKEIPPPQKKLVKIMTPPQKIYTHPPSVCFDILPKQKNSWPQHFQRKKCFFLLTIFVIQNFVWQEHYYGLKFCWTQFFYLDFLGTTFFRANMVKNFE